jgi:hypothetical protein
MTGGRTMTEPNSYPSEEEICDWVERTVLLYGGRRSTALRCAAEFAAAFERGEIRARPGRIPSDFLTSFEV